MGMKAKTIKAVLSKKLNRWFKSIKEDRVRKIAEDNSIVTGGSIASMLLGEPVNDYDIYFRTREAAADIADHYANLFDAGDDEMVEVEVLDDRVRVVVKSAGMAGEPAEALDAPADESEAVRQALSESPGDEPDKAGFSPRFITSNAITLTDKVQLVFRFFGDPETIHENYDFVHCTSYYTSWNKHLELPKAALVSLLSKELRYVGSKYPICSIIRMRKFVGRGWHINAGQILKCCWQVHELDLSDPEVLEEQMTGVDLAYFQQVISLLRERDSEKVDATYLFEVLDRVF